MFCFLFKDQFKKEQIIFSSRPGLAPGLPGTPSLNLPSFITRRSVAQPGNSDPKPDVLPITLPGKLFCFLFINQLLKNKKLVARPGLEPGNSDPKPDVLPITLPGR